MFSVLIVEDFFIDRENLKDIVESLGDTGVSLAGTCENGHQALEFIRARVPDIVICDIEMPGMSGLELGRTIKREHPSVKLIYSTLYNHFSYAKEALELESFGYILKPVDTGELRQCLEKAVEHIRTQSVHAKEEESFRRLLYENMPVLSENFVKNLVYGLNNDETDIWEKASFLGLDIQPGLFMLALLEIDDYQSVTAGQTMEQKQIFSMRIYNRIQDLAASAHVLPARLDDFHFAVLLSGSSAEPTQCAFALSGFCSRVIAETPVPRVSLSASVSDSCGSVLEISRLYEQCCYILRYKYSLGKGKVLYSGDVQPGSAITDTDYKGVQREVRFLLNAGNPSDICSFVENLFNSSPCGTDDNYMKKLGFHVAVCIQTVLNENNEDINRALGEDRPIWEMLVQFETVTDTREWLKQTLVKINDFLAAKNNKRNKAISNEVIKYIENNYKCNLSLETISADLFYSPNYLNSLFKHETGSTIYDYICRYRMEKAREMLTDPKIRIYDIAEALGYCQLAYFNTVFKKYTGLTPKEYRERVL